MPSHLAGCLFVLTTSVACATYSSGRTLADAVRDALTMCNYGRSPAVAIEPDDAFTEALAKRVAIENGLSEAAKADIERHFGQAMRAMMTDEDASVGARQVAACVERELHAPSR